MHVLPFAAAGAVLLAFVVGLPEAKPQEPVVRAHIDARGSATFLVADGDRWQPSWFVNCAAPLRGCIARSSGAILRLDSSGQPWLLLSTSADDTLLLRENTLPEKLRDITTILSHPITEQVVFALSRPKAELVILSGDGTKTVLKVQGTAQVVEYLKWLATPTARGLRDARQWLADKMVDIDGLNPDQLKWYRVMKPREEIGQNEIAKAQN